LTDVVVVCEGITERTFIQEMLAPSLGSSGLYLHAPLIPTSTRGRGGALSWNRVLNFVRNLLAEWSGAYISTFFDLYALPAEFPGFADVQSLPDPRDRARNIEEAFHDAVVAATRCRPEYFFAHVQPHEFEALLFSNIDVFAEVRPEWLPQLGQLKRARGQLETPEHINLGFGSHPSARLAAALRPRYDKVVDGLELARRIGLDRIREQCVHFDGWMSQLEALQPSSSGA
jgi:hypothetical protein